MLLSRSNLRDLYWTIAQLVTHHTSNGCNLRPGDLLATGTVSGPDAGSEGCLLEKKHNAEPVRLPSGEARTLLEDGDRSRSAPMRRSRDCRESALANAPEPFQVQSMREGTGLHSASGALAHPPRESR